MGSPRTPACRPGRAARRAQGAIRKTVAAPATPAPFTAGSTRRSRRNPLSFLGPGTADTESVQRGNPVYSRLAVNEDARLHPCPSGWYGPKCPRLCEDFVSPRRLRNPDERVTS
ncbi:hypothetical protein MUG91_G130n1 [Manis pentadactyla]|nr:hypothetical protein MUG91_G130n1 [Manis pentadactyla]